MTRPRQVKIGYATVSIKYVSDNVLDRVADDEDERLYGCFISRANVIYLYEGLTNLQLADTFLHECLHAHAHINGIRFKETDSEKAEETAINCASAATVELWIRNPKVKKWWDSLFEK